MCKSISMRDVLKCLEYVGKGKYNEVTLLNKENDPIVIPILHELGIDVRKSIHIMAVKHRDLQDNIGIGYRYYGTIRTDRQWINSPLCDLTERVAISAFSDLSLTRELCGLMGKTIDVSTMDGAYTMDDEMNSTDFIVETYEADKKLIDELNAVAKMVRGDE